MARSGPVRAAADPPVLATVNRDDLPSLAELINAGKITSVTDRTCPLSDVLEGIRYLQHGHARGNTVITV